MNQRLVVKTTTARPSEIKTCCLTFEHWLRRSGSRKFGYNNRTVSSLNVVMMITTFLVFLSGKTKITPDLIDIRPKSLVFVWYNKSFRDFEE